MRQAPEGFYTVDAKALNPGSRWHRSFNLGFPNASTARIGARARSDGARRLRVDRLLCHDRSGRGRDLAPGDRGAEGGQQRFQVHVFPFRMTEENLALRADMPNGPFWRDLKLGYDVFEETQIPPNISVCQGRYAVSRSPAVSDGSSAIDSQCVPTAAVRS